MAEQQPVTLYGVASPNVIKVAILLEELGLPYELRYTDVFRGAQYTPEFQAMNPLGKVPVVTDPVLDRPLAESGAILFYFAEREGRFLPPAGAPDRYEVMQWLMVQMASIGPMLGTFTHFRLLPEGSEPYSFGRYQTLAEKLYRLIDTRVADREWLAGDDYSIADIATFPWGEYIVRHGFDFADYPSLQRWCDRINARPAVVRAKARVYGEFGEASGKTMQSATKADLDRFFGRSSDMPDMDYSAVTRMR